MDSPVSPVIVNIYMEYFEELAPQSGPQCPILTPLLKRYVGDIISIVNEEQADTPLNLLNSVNPHIKFIMEAPGSDGSTLFLDTKCSPNSDFTIQHLYMDTNSHQLLPRLEV